MKNAIASLGFLAISFGLMGQSKKVLHYTETSGFDHQTRANSLTLFQQLGATTNFTVTDDNSGAAFSVLSNLLSYDLIVFSNTSGNTLLDSTQQSHFELYIQNGGALLGIHAATDTYRHSSANGNRIGSWDFYAQTIGGSVQENPNHVSGTPNYTIRKLLNHPISQNIPNNWNKNEEYYYWENGYLDSTINILFEVEQTVGPNNLVNSYDSARAVAWYKTLASGSNIFYTSLGHANSNFTSDSLFQQLLSDATQWCLGLSTGFSQVERPTNFSLFPNPAKNSLYITGKQLNGTLKIYTNTGKLVLSKNIKSPEKEIINLNELRNGLYFVECTINSQRSIQSIIINK